MSYPEGMRSLELMSSFAMAADGVADERLWDAANWRVRERSLPNTVISWDGSEVEVRWR